MSYRNTSLHILKYIFTTSQPVQAALFCLAITVTGIVFAWPGERVENATVLVYFFGLFIVCLMTDCMRCISKYTVATILVLVDVTLLLAVGLTLLPSFADRNVVVLVLSSNSGGRVFTKYHVYRYCAINAGLIVVKWTGYDCTL